nr:suface antigen 13 [Eimeria intestinalis]
MLVVLLLVAVAAALTQQNGEGRSTLRSRDVSGTPLLRSYGPSESVNVWSTDDAYFSGVPPACYKSFEKLRMEDLRHPLGKLTPDTELGEQARAKVKELARSGCEQGMNATGKEVGGLFLMFHEGIPDCSSLLDAALNECLQEWGSTPPPAYGTGQFWDSAPAQACSVMLWTRSHKIGCGFSHGCPQMNFLICYTSPAPAEGEQAFSAAQYESLVDRKNEAPKVTVPPSGSSGSLGLHVAAASFACAAAVLLLTS